MTWFYNFLAHDFLECRFYKNDFFLEWFFLGYLYLWPTYLFETGSYEYQIQTFLRFSKSLCLWKQSKPNFGEYFEPLRYSSKLGRFIYYSYMNLWKITLKYSLWPRFEYLYFGQILHLFVEVNRISSNYSCFWPFVGQNWIIMGFAHFFAHFYASGAAVSPSWLSVCKTLAQKGLCTLYPPSKIMDMLHRSWNRL